MKSLLRPHQISHGTIECTDMIRTRRFLTEFLGLDVVRAMKLSQYISKGGPWSIVCVNVSAMSPRAPESHFELCVDSEEAVDEAYRKAVQFREEYGMREVKAVVESDGIRSFAIHDLDGSWWVISNFTPDRLDALFDAGNVEELRAS